MAIRSVKVACTLPTHEDKIKFKEETGVYLNSCCVRTQGMHDEPELCIEGQKNEQLAMYYVGEDVITHKTAVVDIVQETVKVMSDIWDTFTYAVVYEPTGPEGLDSEDPRSHRDVRMFRHVHLFANSDHRGSTNFRIAEIDAPAWIMEIYEYYKKGLRWAELHDAKAKQERQALDAKIAEAATIRKDKWVQVVRGRKVPKGTKGLVFWMSNTKFGIKLGLAVPEEDGTFKMEKREGKHGKKYDSYRNICWVAEMNCEVISTPKSVIEAQKNK